MLIGLVVEIVHILNDAILRSQLEPTLQCDFCGPLLLDRQL